MHCLFPGYFRYNAKNVLTLKFTPVECYKNSTVSTYKKNTVQLHARTCTVLVAATRIKSESLRLNFDGEPAETTE